MKAKDIKGVIHFGLITVIKEEFDAVLNFFPSKELIVGKRDYVLSVIQNTKTQTEYKVAIVKCGTQGNGQSQQVTRDLIDDLAPKWIILCGIAGGVPTFDFSLGDIVIADKTSMDGTVGAEKVGERTIDATGLQFHKSVEKILGILEALGIETWTDKINILMPTVEIKNELITGSDTWKQDVKATLVKRFPTESNLRKPLFVTGKHFSADLLRKDPFIIESILKQHRKAVAFEMELAGVCRSAGYDYPVLAIRGISDIIGFKKGPDWLNFACCAAAAFTHTLIENFPYSLETNELEFQTIGLAASNIKPSVPETLKSILTNVEANEVEQALSQSSEIVNTILNHLNNGRYDNDVTTAKKSFRQALDESEKILESSKIAPSLYLESLSELVDIEYEIKARTILWNKLLKKTLEFLNYYKEDDGTILHCCDIIVFCSWDPFVQEDFDLLKKALNVLKQKIDALILVKGVTNSSGLLSKKATVLRTLSRYEVTEAGKKNSLTSALRCVEKSIEISEDNWYSFVEYGNCLWELLTFEKNPQLIKDKIIQTESAYLRSQAIKLTVQNTLALCRLYKATYQTAPFLITFQKYEIIETNRRRFLQNSFYLAEIAMSMYYSKFPQNLLEEYLSISNRLLNESISAGYNNARIITNLAFINAANNNVGVGERILKSLKSDSSTFNWDDIVEGIKSISDADDLFSQGFVLGIDNPNIWNKLGTFAVTFLDDIDLGIRMYQCSLKFHQNNPIVLTNIARALLRTPLNKKTLEEAEYYISKASSFSTFRFQWWRQVRAELEKAKNNFYKLKPEIFSINQLKMNTISDLYKSFLSLKGMESSEEREIEFENLVNSFYEMSLGNSENSVIRNRININQNVASFFFIKQHYKIEARWTDNQTDVKEINDFYLKHRTLGLAGLIISMMGFTSTAIERARSIKADFNLILMDGEELEATLKGSPSFDEAIRLKQLYLYYEDNPYYKIVSNNRKFENRLSDF